jgi:CheY-like chemotaxis protein
MQAGGIHLMVNSPFVEEETDVSQIVLVADDSMTIQRMATEMLTEQGLEVVTVANGVAAIKKLATMKPAMVVADVDMPGRDGYEVCDFVKNSADLSGVPVILTFSDQDPLDQERIVAVKADGVMKKPFNKPELVARVEELIGKPMSAPSFGSCPLPAEEPSNAAHDVHPPAEFTISAGRALASSLKGIPEGAGPYEPQWASRVPTETVLEPGASGAEFSFAPEASTTSILAGGSPGAAATEPELAEATPHAAERLSIFMDNTSAEAVNPFRGAETLNPISATLPKTSAIETDPFIIETRVRGSALESSALETSPEGERRDAPADSGDDSLRQSAEDSRLGDWKLEEAQRAKPIQEPAPPALPDFSALLGSAPAAPAGADQVTVDEAAMVQPGRAIAPAQPAAEEKLWKAHAEPQPQETVSPSPVATESLLVLSEPESDFPPTVLTGTAGEAEEVAASEDSADVASNGLASAGAWQPPAALAERDQAVEALMPEKEAAAMTAEVAGYIQMPSSPGADETLESIRRTDGAEDDPARVPEVKSWFTAEEVVGSSPAPAFSAPSDVAQETEITRIQEKSSWEIPSEADLNKALTEAALSSIGLLHRASTEEAHEITEPAPVDPAVDPALNRDVATTWNATPGAGQAEAEKPAVLPSLNQKLVESIVHRVVVRMSPSALSPGMIEQITRELAGECLEEMESGQF